MGGNSNQMRTGFVVELRMEAPSTTSSYSGVDGGSEEGASLVPETAPSESVNEAPETNATAADSVDPLRRFRTMLRVGIPRQAVNNKMIEEGLDPCRLDLEVDAPSSSNAATGGITSKEKGAEKADSDDKLARYVRMLKMGIPRQGVENKMMEAGLDPALLSDTCCTSTAATTVGTNDSPSEVERKVQPVDPRAAKYLRMLKMGIPRQGVENKMMEEGLDPALLDGGGDREASLKLTGAAVEAPPAPAKKKKKKKDQIRRKKLFWEVNDSDLATKEGSIWASRDEDGPVEINQKQFKELFTESPKEKAEDKKDTEEPKEQKKKELNILDPRRSQNAAIALSRIRMKNAEIRRRVSILDDSSFSVTQLQALLDYLPTPDERMLIKAFSGDPATLSPAENFMREMMPLQNASPLLSVMLFKRQHGEQVDSLRESTSYVSSACEAVMGSRKLRIAMKMIRRIGNQMNETDVPAFALSSLASLTGTKAYDKKTTVLRFLVQELSAYTGARQGEESEKSDGEDGVCPVADLGDCLDFPESMPDLRDAAATSYRTLERDLAALRTEIKRVGLVIAREVTIIEKDEEREPIAAAMVSFIESASSSVEELQGHLQESKEIFTKLLAYLGISDTKTTPEQIFQPLAEFMEVFVAERAKFRSSSSKKPR